MEYVRRQVNIDYIFSLFCQTGVNVSSVPGRVNESILFNVSEAYFQANGFTLLGASYRSYSIALWVYRLPTAVENGTIVHLSK
jgi:hypothetical protein